MSFKKKTKSNNEVAPRSGESINFNVIPSMKIDSKRPELSQAELKAIRANISKAASSLGEEDLLIKGVPHNTKKKKTTAKGVAKKVKDVVNEYNDEVNRVNNQVTKRMISDLNKLFNSDSNTDISDSLTKHIVSTFIPALNARKSLLASLYRLPSWIYSNGDDDKALVHEELVQLNELTSKVYDTSVLNVLRFMFRTIRNYQFSSKVLRFESGLKLSELVIKTLYTKYASEDSRVNGKEIEFPNVDSHVIVPLLYFSPSFITKWAKVLNIDPSALYYFINRPDGQHYIHVPTLFENKKSLSYFKVPVTQLGLDSDPAYCDKYKSIYDWIIVTSLAIRDTMIRKASHRLDAVDNFLDCRFIPKLVLGWFYNAYWEVLMSSLSSYPAMVEQQFKLTVDSLKPLDPTAFNNMLFMLEKNNFSKYVSELNKTLRLYSVVTVPGFKKSVLTSIKPIIKSHVNSHVKRYIGDLDLGSPSSLKRVIPLLGIPMSHKFFDSLYPDGFSKDSTFIDSDSDREDKKRLMDIVNDAKKTWASLPSIVAQMSYIKAWDKAYLADHLANLGVDAKIMEDFVERKQLSLHPIAFRLPIKPLFSEFFSWLSVVDTTKIIPDVNPVRPIVATSILPYILGGCSNILHSGKLQDPYYLDETTAQKHYDRYRLEPFYNILDQHGAGYRLYFAQLLTYYITRVFQSDKRLNLNAFIRDCEVKLEKIENVSAVINGNPVGFFRQWADIFISQAENMTMFVSPLAISNKKNLYQVKGWDTGVGRWMGEYKFSGSQYPTLEASVSDDERLVIPFNSSMSAITASSLNDYFYKNAFTHYHCNLNALWTTNRNSDLVISDLAELPLVAIFSDKAIGIFLTQSYKQSDQDRIMDINAASTYALWDMCSSDEYKGSTKYYSYMLIRGDKALVNFISPSTIMSKEQYETTVIKVLGNDDFPIPNSYVSYYKNLSAWTDLKKNYVLYGSTPFDDYRDDRPLLELLSYIGVESQSLCKPNRLYVHDNPVYNHLITVSSVIRDAILSLRQEKEEYVIY